MIRTQRTSSAFTLVELIVAMGVGMLLIVIALALSADISGKMRSEGDRLETQAVARFTLDRMESDIGAMVATPAPGEWLVLRSGTARLGALQSDELIFYTVVSDHASPAAAEGEISAVSYALRYQSLPTRVPKLFYGLYRTVIEAPRTFEQSIGSDNLASYWDDGGNYHADAVSPASLLSRNVIGIGYGLKCRLRDETVHTLEIGATPKIPSPLRLWTDWKTATQAIPVGSLFAVEINLTLLSRKGEEMLRNSAMPVDEIVKRYAYTYTRLVPVHSRPVR